MSNSFNKSAAQVSMLEDIAKSFNNPSTFPDLKIQVGGKIILCHKTILARHSKWLQMMWSKTGFYGYFIAQLRDDNVEFECFVNGSIGDIALRSLLEYCYTLEYSPQFLYSYDAAIDVATLVLAESFEIEGLTVLVSERLRNWVPSGHCEPNDIARALQEVYYTLYIQHAVSFEHRPSFVRDVLGQLIIENAGEWLKNPATALWQFLKEDEEFFCYFVQGLAQTRKQGST